MTWLLFLLMLGLAFANGANDVAKGIATLAGSGVTNYRRAVAWGTAWTIAGVLAAGLASQALVATFSGKDILRDGSPAPAFLFAVAIGAIGWLVVATVSGLPVSTTHSLTGALIGAALVSSGFKGVQWGMVATKVALPLAASPLMSLVLLLPVLPLSRPIISVEMLHWLSAGATSFFRGLNDAPKIVALGIGAAAALGVSATPAYALLAVAMGAGSMIAGVRVTRTMAEKITTISPSNGFAANVVTSALVALASFFALPVSTTHVASGAIIGIGATNGVQWRTVRDMLLAWLVTLPVSALLAAGVRSLVFGYFY